jgi:transposase-like protein
MPRAMAILLNEAMKRERSTFLGAGPYERDPARRGHANGFKPKQVRSRVGELALEIPQVRGLAEGAEGFYPQSLERGLRSERALKLAIAEMYVQGVSTRKVAAITRTLCGADVSSTTVSRASGELDAELETWRKRPLGTVRFLVLDARYEKVRHGGAVVDCAVLIATGVRPDGKRTILGVSVSLSEAEVHWRAFLASLQERGLHGVEMVTSDDHAGLKAALAARMPGVPWQRCQFHLQQNATAYVPRQAMRGPVARALRTVFDAPDRRAADERLKEVVASYRDTAPRFAEWAEESVPQGLTVLALASEYRRRLRTTNGLERLNREIKRRTDVVGIFPNATALLRLSTCVLIEAHDEWQDSDRRYLSEESMALLNPPAPTILEPRTTTQTRTKRREIAATA